MAQPHLLTALVTFLALLTYLVFGLNVGRLRARTDVAAPAVSGHPDFERGLRVQLNTLEWLPLFLGSMWLFSIYWSDRVAAGVGVVWILGRIVYARGYMADPAKRAPGFGIQALATLVLLLGGLGRVIWLIVVGGA